MWHYPYPSISAFSDARDRVKKDRNYQNHTKNVPQRSFEVKLFPKIWWQCSVFTSHSVIPVSYEAKLKQSTSVFNKSFSSFSFSLNLTSYKNELQIKNLISCKAEAEKMWQLWWYFKWREAEIRLVIIRFNWETRISKWTT